MGSKEGRPTYLMMCDREILYHTFLCVSSIAVIVAQATILNFYIIAYFRGHRHYVATYFWFLGDLFVVCFVATSCVTAYRYIHLRKKLGSNKRYNEDDIQKKILHSIYKYVSFLRPRYCGTLPFSFISWFAYSSFLAIKIIIIFSNGIPNADFDYTAPTIQILSAGSNLLKVTIGMSALIFIIMLQAHQNDDNPHSPCNGHIAGICHNTAIEVFDSVTLLSLLIIRESEYLPDWHLDQAIIALSSLNLVLPTLAIYMLSLSDFGRQISLMLPIKFVYQILQLVFINIPFLCIRMYLWVEYNHKLSLFVVKNLCYIFMLLHSLYPTTKYMIRLCFRRSRRKSQLQRPTSAISKLSESDNRGRGGRGEGGDSEALEMTPMKKNQHGSPPLNMTS